MLSFAYKSQTNKPSVLTMSLFSVFGCFDIWELADTGGTGLWGQPVPRESEQLTWEQTTHLGVCLSNADQPDLSLPPAPSPSPHTPAAGHLPASLSSDAGQLGRPRTCRSYSAQPSPRLLAPPHPAPPAETPLRALVSPPLATAPTSPWRFPGMMSLLFLAPGHKTSFLGTVVLRLCVSAFLTEADARELNTPTKRNTRAPSPRTQRP